MNTASRLIGLLTILIAFPAPVRAADASGGEFTSALGFSIQYPDGWTPMSKEQSDEARKAIAPVVAKLGVNLDQVTVMIVKPGDGPFAPNLNVVVTNGVIALREADKARMRENINKIAAALSGRASDVSVDIEQVNGAGALVGRYVITGPNGSMRQTQTMVPGKDKTYIVTCSALAADWEDQEAAFKGMIDSLKVARGMPKAAEAALLTGGFGLIALCAPHAAALFVRARLAN